MRVALCAQIPFMQGGAEFLCGNLYRSLIGRGHEVEYVKALASSQGLRKTMGNNAREKEGVTILLVSHDLDAVRRFFDRTLLPGSGEQRAFGDAVEIMDRYVYVGKDTCEEIQSGPTRWGDGKAKITDIKLIDKFGADGTRVNSFDSMVLRICYNAIERLKDPIFGIALYSEQGHHLYGANTAIKTKAIDYIKGQGHTDLRIERIPMLSGKFLTNNCQIINLISRQLQFAGYVIFSIPSGYCPPKKPGNERKMFTEDWEKLLKAGGFDVIKTGYYIDDWHIACVIRSNGLCI